MKIEDSKIHEKHDVRTEEIFDTVGMLPHRYVYLLTNRCNLACDFCFQDTSKPEITMTAEDWINVTDQLPPNSRVTLTGGEPLLFPEFEKVFKYVAECFECNMITNGIPLTKEIIDLLLSFNNFKVLAISIDNIKNTIRGVSAKSWVKMEEMLHYFIQMRNERKIDCNLDIKTIILEESSGELFEIYKYCVEKLHCDTFAYQFLKGAPLHHANNVYNFNDIFKEYKAPVYKRFDIIREQLELVRKYNVENGKKAFLHPKIGSLTSKEPLPDLNYFNVSGHVKEDFLPCKFPSSSVHINYDSRLIPCMAISLGSVKEKALAEIFDGDIYKKFMEIIRTEGTVPGCNHCGWLRPAEELLCS
jgi:MoaA/NifB/PqqE/SkfB family radical SAM enzyme